MTPAKLEDTPTGGTEAPSELTYRWANRTPEQKLADRAEAMKWIRPSVFEPGLGVASGGMSG